MSLLGVDVGTSGTKAMAFDLEGKPIAAAYREYALHSPRRGWLELDPYEVERAIADVLREVAAATTSDPITALSVSAQGEAAVPIAKDGRFLSKVQVSLDERTDGMQDWWRERVDPVEMFTITGHTIHSIYTLSRTKWIKDNQPDVYSQIDKLLCFQEFVFYMLGCEPVTDYSQAARTMGFDVQNKVYSDKLFDLAGIEKEKFPRVESAGTAIGTVGSAASEKFGLPQGTVCVTGGHDQPCNALGAGIITGGKAVFGTGTVDCITPAFDQFIADEHMMSNNLACYPHVLPDKYVSVAYNATGGNLLKWYRDTLAHEEKQAVNTSGINTYDEILSGLPDGPSTVMVLPHFTITGTPWFDANSKGAILGLSLGTTKKEIVKGLIEGTTFEMKQNLQALLDAGLEFTQIRSTGGGAKSALWNQLKADMLNVPIATLQTSEGGALGTAILAGVATGEYSSIEEAVDTLIHEQDHFEPRREMVEAYDEKFEIYRKLYPALKEINHTL